MAQARITLQLFAGVNLLFPAVVQAIETTTSTPELATGYLLRVTLGLLAVLVSIVLAARLLRGFTYLQTGTHGQFKILSAISMGPRERIVLLQIGENQLLIGVVPGRIQTLHVLERPIDVTCAPPSSSPGFPAVLGAALKRGKAV
ncbi:MAG: flagellar biosynthetic protein FliO [Gammaproteobacteria bacterium]|jgi:flagellar protein FliO/FliZ